MMAENRTCVCEKNRFTLKLGAEIFLHAPFKSRNCWISLLSLFIPSIIDVCKHFCKKFHLIFQFISEWTRKIEWNTNCLDKTWKLYLQHLRNEKEITLIFAKILTFGPSNSMYCYKVLNKVENLKFTWNKFCTSK